MSSEQPLLRVTDLSVTFGVVRAVDQVALSVDAGELVGLIGPNGAGKTTTVDAVCGFVPHGGSVRFEGRELQGWAPYRRARVGLARTWQSLELFDDLTVLESCAVGAELPSWSTALRSAVRPHGARDVAAAEAALAAVGLDDVADRWPAELSLGQRKLVAVARALAARPRLLLLDEPAAGLDSEESLELGRRLRDLVATGLGVLLIDHDMGLVLGTCDRVDVLEFGRIIASGTPEAIREDARVVEAYLGEAHATSEAS